MEIREGLNYNPYFPGGAIGMARVLFDGLVEYEDGKGMRVFLSCTINPTSLVRYSCYHISNGQGRRNLFVLGC